MGMADTCREDTPDNWSDDRRETAYQEARSVLDAQNTTMQDIDDKAMRTVRVIVLLISLLVAGLQYRPELFDPLVLAVSTALLVGAVLAGIATYDESNLYVGPRGEYIEDLAASEFEDAPWEQDLLETFAGMIAENYDNIQRNARYLRATNGLLALGIIVAGVAIVI